MTTSQKRSSPSSPATTLARQWFRLSRLRPTLAIVLGSGFAHVSSNLKVEREIPYNHLPGFPVSGVKGHGGKVLLDKFGDEPVCILSGRAHFYEGHTMEALTFPIRVLAEFGIRHLLLTNAAGGINSRFRPGDFMSVTDHLNWMGANPLRGEPAADRERFVDLTQAYDLRLTQLVRRAAKRVKLKLHAGVYLAVSGPSYETPAEIRAFARLGADAIGMSTVPEVIVARQCGLAVAALSCITNLAAGRGNALLSHADVLATGEKARPKASALVEQFVKFYAVARESGFAVHP